MRKIYTVLLLAIFINAMMFAQNPLSNLMAKCPWKNILDKAVCNKSVIHNSVANINGVEKVSAVYTTFYTSCYSMDFIRYQSQRLNNPGDPRILNPNPSYNGVLTEGTMDEDGFWYGIFMYPSIGGSLYSGALGKPNDAILPFTIKKIDKSTGEIIAQYPMNSDALHLGIAFNPIDKLIYFTQYPMHHAPSNGDGTLSKPNGVNRVELWSLNPKTGQMIKVHAFEEVFIGLAISNEGVFYTANIREGMLQVRLAKFTLGSFNLDIFGEDLVTQGLFPEFCDLEIDATTGKCYISSLSVEGITGADQNDGSDMKTEFREISLATGLTYPIYSYPDQIVGGVAFSRTLEIISNNGKLVVTYPNGGEKLIAGKYYNIMWKNTGGIVKDRIQLEYSTDGGTRWTKINTVPLAGVVKYPWYVSEAMASKLCLVRMTNYLTGKEIDRSDDEFEIVKASMSETSNYPNPFNPSTKIVFSLDKKSMTSLKIFNSIGQQVAELVNKELEAGVHEYQFNAANLTSGVYFYKLEKAGVSEMHKMILMK